MVLHIRYVPCECSVYWVFCIYFVFVVVAFFLKHQGCFTIVETKRLGTNPGFLMIPQR